MFFPLFLCLFLSCGAVIGLTNRRDLIDPALLRPGRLEVHLEIQAPDEKGRSEILSIHLRKLLSTGRLEQSAWDAVEQLAKEKTEGWSGAELAGLVRSATSFALQRTIDSVEKASTTSTSTTVTTTPSSPSAPPSSLSSSAAVSRAAGLNVRVSADDLQNAYLEIEEARPRRRWSWRRSAAAIFSR